MFSEYNFRNYNFRLLFYVLALNLVGVVVINSAVGGDRSYVNRQLIGMFGGLMLAIAISLMDYRKLMKCCGLVYIGCVGILLAVLGGFGGGSRRWIDLPVIGRFQPSEFVKIGLIFFFSWFLQKNQEKINRPSVLVTAAVLAAVPLALILKQPDLSTSIVIVFFILCLIYMAGISYKWIAGALAVAVPSLALVVWLAEHNMMPFLEPYQINRILAFINPGKYAELNLQQDNSKMAIGSGRLYGKGLFNDTAISVKNGNFLSEEHTDFIFSVIGEELGFIGCMIVLLLFPSFVPKTFIVSTVLNNVGATGILLGAVGVYIMVSLKEGMPAVQLFSKNIGWSIIFILAAALSIADAMAAESTGISAWLVELITPVVQGKSPLVLTAVMCVVGMALTNVANNIATAAMLTPIAYSVGIACGANPAALAVCVLLATNMGMATPPASAPAAIVHGEKEWIPGSDAVKYGLVCCGITLVLILAVIFPMANVMF